MIKELTHDNFILSQKSAEATAEDIEIANNLYDTLKSHQDTCVGMAANMIGSLKRIICFYDDKEIITMMNPVIIKKAEKYEAIEGCLSYLDGPKKVERYKSIKVQYQNLKMQPRIKTFKGFTAQIIQHEIDHCNGILI